MEPLVDADGRVDVERVMTAVRDAVRKRRDGLTLEQAVDAGMVEIADESGIDPELLTDLLARDPGWNISPDYRIETHRRGLDALAVVLLKRMVRAVVRLYTDPVIIRQAQVNLYLLHAVRSLLTEVTRLRRVVADLEGSVDKSTGDGGNTSRP
jgi:hypothetical protein